MVDFETMRQVCSLCTCRLADEGESVLFEFPNVSVRIAKNSKIGEVEATLFMVNSWLEALSLQQFFCIQDILNNEKDKEVSHG